MRIEAANLIDGRLVPASGGRTLDTIEPATGSAWGTLPDSDSSDVNAAVAAAEKAFLGWAATPVRERSACLRRLADLVERDLDALALAESTDTGKPLALARAMDIPRAAANLRFFAGAIEHDGARTYRTDAPAPAPGQAAEAASPVAWNTVLKRPLGVVGLISPWNLPLYLLTWKIAPALACGNTAVCKPSELTPATAFMLARLTVEAGLPPGVLNIVHGPGASAGAPLVAHPSVKAVSFTGGTATGAAISASAAPRFKKLSLELGGKNAAIVFDDVDAERTAGELVRAAFSNQGQICLCASRVLVQRGVYERFVAGFVGLASALRIGDPLDAQTQQGALVSAAHRDKVE
ncbi:MAG: aldehyde dehydrogenase family protein, partial [Planctomycetes bacterium]|nr:aldehyde dehydrogenase family protein [Planctomycetota bacterium]